MPFHSTVNLPEMNYFRHVSLPHSHLPSKRISQTASEPVNEPASQTVSQWTGNSASQSNSHPVSWQLGKPDPQSILYHMASPLFFLPFPPAGPTTRRVSWSSRVSFPVSHSLRRPQNSRYNNNSSKFIDDKARSINLFNSESVLRWKYFVQKVSRNYNFFFH